MITPEEIRIKSIDFNVDTSNVQRDYVFGWVLWGIFTTSDLKDALFLKGGNALRKAYFEDTRFSSDLDFGMEGDIEQDYLLQEINKVCQNIEEKAGVVFVSDENKIKEKFIANETPLPDLKVYEIRVYFKDFFGKSEHIKLRTSMDVTRFDKVILPIQTRQLIHPYSDADNTRCEIKCMKLEEIIATKLKCLMQRQHAPDLFDYVYSIKLLGGELNKDEVVHSLIKKTIFSRNPFLLKNILLKTTFDYFREQWAKSIICAKQVVITVEEAISVFADDLHKLFAGYQDNGYTQFAYFDAEFRSPIMLAGRTQTLLKIVYKGEVRIVEPYSLKYQQRRDGVELEYFFAYKLSGGTSEPGIKRFVAQHMVSIENTETKFDPRYQIELSKAGETPEDKYTFDPNNPVRSPRRSPSIKKTGRSTSDLSNGMKYKYKCAYCGKVSIKSSMDPNLKSHKNKNGYTCNSNYGYYIGAKY